MDRVFGGVYQSKNNNDLLSNNPVSTGSPSVGSLSPYLNIDPKTLAGSQESQYLDVEGEINQRGSFERSFSLIGTSMCAGVGAQFIKQTYITLRTGRQNTNRSILISQVSKALARTGIKFGIASIRFSLLSVLFEKARGESDVMNGAIAGASVGLLEARKVAVSPKVKLPPLKLGGLVGGYAVVGLALGALLHDRFFTKHRVNK